MKNKPTKPSTPYTTGLALSGGGARGFAHLGALKAMEERGIAPDIISGTSVGSLVATFVADGYTVDEIMDIASHISFTSIAEGTIPRSGFFKTTGVQNLLKKYIRARNFEDLRVPVRIVASDIELGRVKVFSKGPIAPAVTASCSVPIVFRPIEIDERHYIDGGMLMNFPVSIIRNLCTRVIGVNISPVIGMKYDDSLKYVVERVMNYMVGANTTQERLLCDYLIESAEVSEFSIFDFKHKQQIFDIGYRTAALYLDDNKQRLLADVPPPQTDTVKKFRNKLADWVLTLKSK